MWDFPKTFQYFDTPDIPGLVAIAAKLWKKAIQNQNPNYQSNRQFCPLYPCIGICHRHISPLSCMRHPIHQCLHCHPCIWMAQLQFGQRNRPELKTGKGLNQGCQKIQKSVGNKETKHLQVDWPFAKNWVEAKNIAEKHAISFRSMGGWLGWKCGISQKLSNILTPLTSLEWSQ